MKCVNCGHENPGKALICYWCGTNPTTGESPYPALGAPAISFWEALVVPEIPLPPPIEVPSPALDRASSDSVSLLDLTIPEPPPISIAPAPDIPEQALFSASRQRARHKPVVRVPSTAPLVMHSLLSNVGRLLVFIGGLVLLLMLALVLIAAIGTASFGGAFCLVGLLSLGAVLWVALLAARAGKRIVAETGEVYERIEVLGQTLREVVPGLVSEYPVNLPSKVGLLDQPVAYSDLRALVGAAGEQPEGLAEDLLTGVITSLVARDDVVLARRNYPVEVSGPFARASTTEIDRPVLVRRRVYVGPGELEGQIARTLRTDQSMTVEELMNSLTAGEGRQRARQVVDVVNEVLSERPPDLDALASPEEALAEFERYRTLIRRTDPELYQLLEDEVRRALAAVMRRPIPSSLLDVARYASDIVNQTRPPQP